MHVEFWNQGIKKPLGQNMQIYNPRENQLAEIF